MKWIVRPGAMIKDWMTDDSYFCTRLIDFEHLKETFFMKGLSRKNSSFLIIERIGCTESIQPSKEVRIVGHSVPDWKTQGHTIHTTLNDRWRASSPLIRRFVDNDRFEALFVESRIHPYIHYLTKEVWFSRRPTWRKKL